ncbi:hypothetical protein [Haloferax sp. ATB1]|uniref:hypothetical protein n=1 Tax=Haloferax sp. ATB1 TaxID=1508454 RepID=UPI000FE14624|nr:hypothetical protein [Haloferax sp. ATB1]
MDINENNRRHEWDSMVINSVRLFEVWMDNCYIALESRISGDERKARNNAQNTGMVPVVEDHLNTHLSYDIRKLEEWVEWKSDVYQERKKVIHDGKQVEESVGKSSFTKTNYLIAAIAEDVASVIGDLPIMPDIDRPE